MKTGFLLISFTIIVIVFVTGFVVGTNFMSQNQTSTTSPTLTPAPEGIPPPEQTHVPETTPAPAPTPQMKTPANLVVNCTLKIVWGDLGKPLLKVLGSITNVGTETAYNVTIHVITWFSNGAKAIAIDYKLNFNDGHITFPVPVNIKGNETYRAGTLVGMRGFDIPKNIWRDWEEGYVDNDCISTYQITASWDTAS